MTDRSTRGESVVLVHLEVQREKWHPDCLEFRSLALSAGAEIVSELSCRRVALDPCTAIGKGKVEELQSLITVHSPELILFDAALSAVQQRNLEKVLQCRVLDRTGLILDIFASRARTHEGKLQVTLAQMNYWSTRLIRGWTHLERQKGGIGLRGPGETQLEVDRRLIKDRIRDIKAKLEKVRRQRQQSRLARSRAGLPTVALVGYTNAGKSTLFNTLTEAGCYAADQMFATLDPTIRGIDLPKVGRVLLTDTVGFIRALPHSLIEAFKATLEEIKEADLLLHVIDGQDPERDLHYGQVRSVLTEIGADKVPVIEVYNKIDLKWGSERSNRGTEVPVSRLRVSARTGEGLELLKEAISERFNNECLEAVVCLSTDKGKERSWLFEQQLVQGETVDEAGNWVLQVRLPKRYWYKAEKALPELSNYMRTEDNGKI